MDAAGNAYVAGVTQSANFPVSGNAADPTYGGTAGPVRNQIPQPDRSVNNSTIWRADFNKASYENMLFSSTPGAISMRNFYIEQSSGRKIQATRKVDPNLIGGLILQVGSRRVDASVRGRLERLRQELTATRA